MNQRDAERIELELIWDELHKSLWTPETGYRPLSCVLEMARSMMKGVMDAGDKLSNAYLRGLTDGYMSCFTIYSEAFEHAALNYPKKFERVSYLLNQEFKQLRKMLKGEEGHNPGDPPISGGGDI